MEDLKLKVVIVGESFVGKTSILKHLESGHSNHWLVPTIGIDFIKKAFKVENKNVILHIWDTAGQERFQSMTFSTFRSCNALVVVYDITKKQSFSRISEFWLEKLNSYMNDQLVPIFLIGNKVDKEAERQVPTITGENLSENKGLHGFYETSAQSGLNIQEAFTNMTEKLAALYGVKSLPPRDSLILKKPPLDSNSTTGGPKKPNCC